MNVIGKIRVNDLDVSYQDISTFGDAVPQALISSVLVHYTIILGDHELCGTTTLNANELGLFAELSEAITDRIKTKLI